MNLNSNGFEQVEGVKLILQIPLKESKLNPILVQAQMSSEPTPNQIRKVQHLLLSHQH